MFTAIHGRWYCHRGGAGHDAMWGGLRLEANMGLLEQGGFDPQVQPDLSPTGAPLTFGFMLWQELAPGAIEAEDAFAVDNWSMQLHLVPEPSSAVLLLVSLAVVGHLRAARP